MNTSNSNITCIKCGGTYDVVGMEATNKALPGAKMTMIRCTCTKCGFMEIRMADPGFVQAAEKTDKD